ncbi:hypothetical protein EON67_01270 [archaeon]|nr:MAG: hypothetical protein EON67_01270 [archaeon]
MHACRSSPALCCAPAARACLVDHSACMPVRACGAVCRGAACYPGDCDHAAVPDREAPPRACTRRITTARPPCNCKTFRAPFQLTRCVGASTSLCARACVCV